MGQRTTDAATWPEALTGRVFPRLSVPQAAQLPLTFAVLAIITVSCYYLHANFALTAFLYFSVAVLYSLVGDLNSSILVSITASACLDFFFLEPVFSFRVLRLVDMLALATFLGTSVTINYLATSVKRESHAATTQRDHVERLFLLAQQLLAQDPETTPRDRTFGLFLEAFQLKAICLFEWGKMEVFPAGSETGLIESAVRRSFLDGMDFDDLAEAISVRCMRGNQANYSVIGFAGLIDPQLIAGPLATLASLILQRERAFRTASRAAALAETEVFRTAILDALAHEFKTPLSTIMAAVGGMQESGPLQPAQMDLARMVESEASRLGALTSRLVRMARLDRENVKPRLANVDLEELLLGVVKRYSKLWPQRRYSIATQGNVESAWGDAELLRLALSQLLDNASKYSPPLSSVEIEAERREDTTTISVWNSGPPIPEAEREHIFERYYRGMNAREIPGTGLGLYVTKRIASAHGGSLSMEFTNGSKATTVFRLSIPSRDKEFASE